ncbi:2Fe-2S iron-sulfur cluster-binding protein [Methylocaldum sp.]|uniref:2Fe-2S iron-sulfur cluster-binding protein n=1 Tax=Methylocaldum sp. TaxID=1969727 RepID=UPI002D358304|nr:2Fe-2S iron-sulfur cluster-binding protein [Methylocaldum sp.]HYE37573.1 2Fe-2S iron-sulfur cluster-binding protein [Methylocaldum sp.]
MTVLPSGKTVQVASGVNLLEVVLAAGEGIVHQCGGRARCGSCHVLVREGCRSLSKIRREELERLARLDGANVSSRLACQAVLGTHNVTVELISH